MKKKLLAALSVAMVAVIAVTGTMAYLTDGYRQDNVMTVGNIKVELFEQQRAYDNQGVVSGLEDFEQNKTLMPVVGSAQGEKDAYGMPVAKNFVDKIVYAKNTGKNDAYMRILLGVPAKLVDLSGDGGANTTDDALHISLGNRVDLTGNSSYNTGAWDKAWNDAGGVTYKNYATTTKIDGEDYYLTEVVFEKAVAPGQYTPVAFAGAYLDSAVDCDNDGTYTFTCGGKKYSLGKLEDIKLPVLVQAVQADGYEQASTALDAGFGTDANAWFGEPFAVVTVLDKNDTLTNAEGTVTILDKDLKIDTTGSKMGMNVGFINLDVAYQFEPNMSKEEGAASEYADWNADFIVSVDKDVPAYSVGLAGYYDAWCSLNNDKWVALASSETIDAGTEIRLVEAIALGFRVTYAALCEYGNDGIGFLCGARDMSGFEFDGQKVADIPEDTTLTVELRLFEVDDNGDETGHYITTGVYTYTF